MGKTLSEQSFVPLPITIPLRHRDPQKPWRIQIATDLWVENSPPRRLILHGDRVVLSYAVDSVVEERMALLQIVGAGWMTALDLGERWGYHGNTLGNWQWRYRYFGLDGLNDQRVPGQREQLEPVVRLAAEILRKQGRRMSVAGLRRELAAHGHAGLPPGAVQWLQGALLQPQALGLPLEEVSNPSEKVFAKIWIVLMGYLARRGRRAAMTSVYGQTCHERTPDPSDLTDAEWDLIAPLVPPARPGGRPGPRQSP
jgi:hypothetical protein